MLFMNFGFLIAYLAGAFMSYLDVPWLHIVFPILFLGGLWFFPETPRFLIMHNQPKVIFCLVYRLEIALL